MFTKHLRDRCCKSVLLYGVNFISVLWLDFYKPGPCSEGSCAMRASINNLNHSRNFPNVFSTISAVQFIHSQSDQPATWKPFCVNSFRYAENKALDSFSTKPWDTSDPSFSRYTCVELHLCRLQSISDEPPKIYCVSNQGKQWSWWESWNCKTVPCHTECGCVYYATVLSGPSIRHSDINHKEETGGAVNSTSTSTKVSERYGAMASRLPGSATSFCPSP